MAALAPIPSWECYARADWEHYRRVALTFPSGSARIVGYYHDGIEDGWISEDDLRAIFHGEVADAVVVLTRRKGESYRDYIDRVAAGPLLAVQVKLADLRDNLARSDGRPSLRPRYERAVETLEAVWRQR